MAGSPEGQTEDVLNVRSLFTKSCRRKRVQSIIALIIILITGIILSVIDQGRSWFHRSGSLIIAVAVFQIIRWRFSYFNAREMLEMSVFAVTLGVALKKGKKYPDMSMEERVDEARRYAVDQYSEDHKALRYEEMLLWMTEAFLLIIGTLIWGFGDLLL